MSTTITDVTELQAMEDDLDGDYVLGNNIDASATSGWNGGLGFDPIGTGTTQYSYSRPESDDFGYAGHGGNWTVYPSDGVFYDKVDEETTDEDTTYIRANSDGDWCLLAHDATALDIPDDATDISVRIYARLRNEAAGVSRVQGMMNIDGTEYLIDSVIEVGSQSYANKSWTASTSPATGLDWTVGSVFNLAVQGVGIKVSDAIPDVIITQIYIRVSYRLPFTGTFDSAGYTISDLYINRPTEDYVGLFGYTDGATVGDVTLEDSTITGNNYIGTLIGYGASSAISDIVITGSTISGDGNDIGGLAGLISGCTLNECSTAGSVTGTGGIGDYYIGGFIGECGVSTITECYSTASATNNQDFVGGFIGLSYRNNIDNCYARGSVTGDRYIGGFIGYSYDSQETIDNCFSTGAVTGNNDVGGFIGYSTSVVSNCFWDITTSGTETSDGGTGYATATMLLFATFSAWNISNATATRNDGYPFLSWEIDESDTIWKIFGEGVYSFDFPDLMDDKGRHPKNARLRAYRTDIHSEPYIIEEHYTDHNGTASFTKLSKGIGAVVQAVLGGKKGTGNEEWFPIRVNDIEDGGTGAAPAAGALDNLGVHGAAIMWELILGD